MPSQTEEKIFFNNNRAAWCQQGHQGKIAVIHGQKLLGFFETWDAATASGKKEYGTSGFFATLVTPAEEPRYWQAHQRGATVRACA